MYFQTQIPEHHISMSNYFFQTVLSTAEIQKCKQLLDRHAYKANSCCLWQGAKDKDGYGIARIHFRGKRIKVRVHRLAYYLYHNLPSMAGKHVSHVCHTKLCFQMSHLSLESSSINNRRKVCVNNGECSGHYGYKRCLLR